MNFLVLFQPIRTHTLRLNMSKVIQAQYHSFEILQDFIYKDKDESILRSIFFKALVANTVSPILVQSSSKSSFKSPTVIMS